MIVLGDFNSISDPEVDAIHTSAVANRQGLALRLDVETTLLSAFRLLHPDLRAGTRVAHTGGTNRLDDIRIALPRDSDISVEAVGIHVEGPQHTFLSDHDPVILDLGHVDPMETIEGRPGQVEIPYWRAFQKLVDEGSEKETELLCEDISKCLEGEAEATLRDSVAKMEALHLRAKETAASTTDPDCDEMRTQETRRS